MKDLGKPKHILRFRVELVKNGIPLSQRQHIEGILRTFSIHKGNKVYTHVSHTEKFFDWEDESSFVPPAHRKIDATCYLYKTIYLIFLVNSFPILFKSSSKTLDIGSKSSRLPQNYSRFRSFPKLWARWASDKLTNDIHWQWFCFLWSKEKKQIWSLHFLS